MTEPIHIAQRDLSWVERSTPEAVSAALHRGELAQLLGGSPAIDAAAMARANAAPVEPEDTSQLSREWVETATPDAIIKARRAGRLNDLLGIIPSN